MSVNNDLNFNLSNFLFEALKENLISRETKIWINTHFEQSSNKLKNEFKREWKSLSIKGKLEVKDWVIDEQTLLIAQSCFSAKDVKLLIAVKEFNIFIKLIFMLTQIRLESKEPLDEDAIKNLHKLLFFTEIKTESEKYIYTNYHPANVIYYLAEALDVLSSGQPLCKTGDEESDFGGFNQTYILKGQLNQNLWIFKPESGEKVNLEGIKAGAGAIREHVACLLNYHRQYSIPYTAYVKIRNQIGSVQAFKSNSIKLQTLRLDASGEKPWEKLDAKSFHYLLLFDARFCKTDRHAGNILCEKFSEKELYYIHAIDNGGCMTNSIQDPLSMEYLSLKQMVLEEFDEETKQFIRNLNVDTDRSIMQAHGIEEAAIEWMQISTNFF